MQWSEFFCKIPNNKPMEAAAAAELDRLVNAEQPFVQRLSLLREASLLRVIFFFFFFFFPWLVFF